MRVLLLHQLQVLMYELSLGTRGARRGIFDQRLVYSLPAVVSIEGSMFA